MSAKCSISGGTSVSTRSSVSLRLAMMVRSWLVESIARVRSPRWLFSSAVKVASRSRNSRI
ncbi:Uncharacterised protein [Mycobacterium tuberculosis]|nr:Uncharacterised protein [Mycobacterium tuberculosis]